VAAAGRGGAGASPGAAPGLLRVYTGHTADATGVAFLPPSAATGGRKTFTTVSKDSSLRVWDASGTASVESGALGVVAEADAGGFTSLAADRTSGSARLFAGG
jgi:WD40 repeat protein